MNTGTSLIVSGYFYCPFSFLNQTFRLKTVQLVSAGYGEEKEKTNVAFRFLDYHKVLSYCSVRVCLCNCFVVFFCIFVHKLN